MTYLYLHITIYPVGTFLHPIRGVKYPAVGRIPYDWQHYTLIYFTITDRNFVDRALNVRIRPTSTIPKCLELQARGCCLELFKLVSIGQCLYLIQRIYV